MLDRKRPCHVSFSRPSASRASLFFSWFAAMLYRWLYPNRQALHFRSEYISAGCYQKTASPQETAGGLRIHPLLAVAICSDGIEWWPSPLGRLSRLEMAHSM